MFFQQVIIIMVIIIIIIYDNGSFRGIFRKHVIGH